MKKAFLFLMLCSSSLLAQPAKVLICAPGDLNAAKALDTTLHKFYHDSIDVSDALTDAISNYEAVFLLINRQHPITQTGSSSIQKYLHADKKLYIEYAIDYFIQSWRDSILFWKFIGVRDFMIDD